MNTLPSPTNPAARRLSLMTAGAALLWAALMAPLLHWGLPDSQRDDLLFGGDPPWPAERYNVEPDLQRLRERNVGADTDLDPLLRREGLIDLTPDDDARAEILRRYRLFSRQPDEMIVFRALQRMNPRQLDFDPRLYQYGGGYIYPVGVAVGGSSVLGLTELTSNAGVYLEDPAQFGRLYVVARCVSLVFGIITLIAVGRLAGRAGGSAAAWLAMLCVAGAPVFITAVVEAKPHLPSAGMILWAVLAALDYRRNGRLRTAVRMGLLAGYAFALVLTGCVAAFLWPALLWTCSFPRRRVLAHLSIAGGVALTVYAICNPYIPYNWLFNPEALASNIGNSTAMYQDQIQQCAAGAVRVGELLVESAGVGILLAGVIGLALLLRRRGGPTIIAAAAGLGMLLIGVLLGAGKPAEYARFLVLPILLLCVSGGWALAVLARRHLLVGLAAVALVCAATRAHAYIGALLVDRDGAGESRLLAGRYLREHLAAGAVVGVLQEPAPYAVPPLDFTRRHVVLLPTERPAELDPTTLPLWLVFTADDLRVQSGAWWQLAGGYELVQRFPPADAPLTRITWANKPVFIYHRVR